MIVLPDEGKQIEVDSEMDKTVELKRLRSSKDTMERCVLCWRLTDIPKDRPIALRDYYLQGQGQLCAKCYYELYKEGVFRHTSDTDESR